MIAGAASVSGVKNKYKNLKILPKNITEHTMDSIMESYSKALNVSCQFCHVRIANFPDSLDYASDKEPMKAEARKMMLMTIDINKKNFYFNKKENPIFLNTVNCMTCHRGEAFPITD